MFRDHSRGYNEKMKVGLMEEAENYNPRTRHLLSLMKQGRSEGDLLPRAEHICQKILQPDFTTILGVKEKTSHQ
ncbi:hypothetical protein GDO81_024183 [Engystomops pustulosus]|uniref:Uncharacterized protein n=1 Tax=Engystomops pustulosus TaxID=76066 RepID=A0AAV6YRM7_ENGPU|nr:hypothetical protein GDO81_024183 [Engystomops pustulosus]